MTMSLRQYFSLRADTVAIPALDGLRGIAILMVVAYHGTEAFAPTGAGLLPVGPWDLATPIYSGWMGVNLFFVLSGFLITYHLLRRWTRVPDGAGLRTYLVKRWLRIVPTYYVVLAIAAAGVVPHHPIDTNLLSLQVAWHALFLQDYLPSSILGPFWSLGVEEKFYLAMPVVLLVAWKAGRVGRVSLVGLFAFLAAVPVMVRVGMYAVSGPSQAGHFLRDWRNPFHLNLDALFLGAICAWLYLQRDRLPLLREARTASAATWTGVGLVAVLMIPAGALGGGNFFHDVALFPFTALGMALVLLGAVLAPPGTRAMLESRWLGRAGRIAYPWYLTHILALHWLLGELGPGLTPGGTEGRAIRYFAFFAAYLTVSVVVALVLHFAVEKPCLILKDRLGERRIPVHAATGTA